VQGLTEAGIDGGGLTREFLTDVLKQGFGSLNHICFITIHPCDVQIPMLASSS
jgi:hypothetical protein